MTAVQRWTLAVVCTATAILMLDIAVVNTALPSIGEDLNTGIGGLQWVVDAYTLALAAVVLTAGSLADRFGRRRVFASGLVVFTVASGACAAAGSIELLDAARAVQGLGAAILFATSLALLADAFPSERERTGALAAYGATIGASFAIGPAVGGALTTALDWRWVFLVNIPIGIAALAVTLREVRESRDPRAPRVDRARPGHADRGPVPARLRPAARQRGRLGQRDHRRLARRRRRRCSPRSWPSRRVRRIRCCRCGLLRSRGVHRRAADRVRDLRLVLRDLPLLLDLPPERARAVRASRPGSCSSPARS